MFSPNFVLSPFPVAQSASPLQEEPQTQTQNFMTLTNRPELIPLSSLDAIYNKNASLLKKNIKLSPKCPNIEEIKTIFNEVYVLSQYTFPIFFFYKTNFFRKSKSTTTGSPQYFFSKGKTLFLWILSVYEHFAHISPEDLVKLNKYFPNFIFNKI